MKKLLLAATISALSFNAFADGQGNSSDSKPTQLDKIEVIASEGESMPNIALGKELYETCVGCHGVKGEGGVGPKLAGQDFNNLNKKLIKYANGETRGPLSAMMIPMVADRTNEELESLAMYIDKELK